MVELTESVKKRINNILNKKGISPDTIDTAAIWDKTLDYKTNIENVMREYGLHRKKANRAYQDEYEKEMIRQAEARRRKVEQKEQKEIEAKKEQLKEYLRSHPVEKQFKEKTQPIKFSGRDLDAIVAYEDMEAEKYKKEHEPKREQTISLPKNMFPERKETLRTKIERSGLIKRPPSERVSTFINRLRSQHPNVRKNISKVSQKARYLGQQTAHIATHDLAPASSKVLVRDYNGKVRQRLKKEVRAADEIIRHYRGINSPFPNAAFGHRKKFLQAHYSNPLEQPSLFVKKLYPQKAFSKKQISIKKSKVKKPRMFMEVF